MANEFIKTLLRPFLRVLFLAGKMYRSCQRILIYAERRDIMGRFGHCEPDLQIVYPWDIRGDNYVFIGKDVFIGPNVLLIADKGAEIHIGDKVMFGPQVKVIAFDHRFDDPDRPIKDSGYGVFRDVTIGNDVWVGTGAFIMKGVHIADGSIIAGGSVLTKSVGPNEIWGGNPARKIKGRFAVRGAVSS